VGETDRDWVGDLMSGTVTRFDQVTAGKSRATWLVDVERGDGSLLELVLRRDTGDGPLSGTELSLARESVVYGALRDTAVPIPRLWGVAPDGQALIVERVAGSEDLTALGDARAGVLDEFLKALAMLHAVDTTTLDLPGFERPASAEDHALCDLALWQRVFEGHVKSPAPLVRFAFRWLHDHAPTSVERTVLCHGDLGPGNFMHAGGKVTAVLDWEFAHLGDPMDDIAWFSIRCAQVLDHRDLSVEIARYEELTGLKVDAERVAYYQLMVLVRMAVACLVALDRAAGQMDTSTYLALLPLLARQITSTDLGSVLLPELQTVAARSRAMGMALLLMHLKTADTLGAPVDAAELDDLAEVLGDRPASVEDGWRQLDSVVQTAGPERYPELIGFFSRHADRQVALWPIIAGLAAKPLPKIGR
jgi:aminoglycoside phosphotransferase (APT) family kinase protein